MLTNQRVVFLKGEDIDYEVPLENIMQAVPDRTGVRNPYLRLELRDGDAISIAFGCVGWKMFLGVFT
jgi:hypothetical protein